MANILALVFLVAIVGFVVSFVVNRRRRPELKLLRDFARLKKSIIGSISDTNRVEAVKLLDACENHLKALIVSKDQQRMLADMRESATELTGKDLPAVATQEMERDLATKLADFFGTLTRISTVVSLGSDETLSQLRGFASDLELQRDSLNELFND